jgi:hypothetical protein
MPLPQLPQFDDEAAAEKTAYASPHEIQAAIRAATSSTNRAVRLKEAPHVEAEVPSEEHEAEPPTSSTLGWVVGVVLLTAILVAATAYLLEFGPFAR